MDQNDCYRQKLVFLLIIIIIFFFWETIINLLLFSSFEFCANIGYVSLIFIIRGGPWQALNICFYMSLRRSEVFSKKKKKKKDVRKFMGDGILTCFYEFKDYCSEIRPIKRTTIWTSLNLFILYLLSESINKHFLKIKICLKHS